MEDAAAWNHDFWEKRNRDFFAERERFVRASIQKARTARTDLENGDDDDKNGEVSKPASASGAVSTEEMSDFYREFLSANKSEHLNYMKGWYARNFRVLKTGLLWFLSEWNVFRRHR